MKKNNNIKRYVLLFGLMIALFSPQIGFGQSSINDHEILQKYWYFRWRLQNDFVYIGEDDGESLPIIQRNKYGEVSFGTGDVSQMLAYYIQTLATEYKLLNDNNRIHDVDKTLTELYYALKAFERLDVNAEKAFPHVTQEADLPSSIDGQIVTVKTIEQNYYDQFEFGPNGYFMREDFPRDFFGDPFTDECSHGGSFDPNNEHYIHFNNSLTNNYHEETFGVRHTTDAKVKYYINDPFGGCSNQYVDEYSTDERAGDDNFPNIYGTYLNMTEYAETSPSIDQIANLLEALLLVKVCLPDNVMSIEKTDGTMVFVNLVQMAKDNASNIINSVKFNLNDPDYSNNGWRVTTPSGYQLTEERGGAAGIVSFPIAQIGNMIHDYNLLLPYNYIPTGFHDLESVTKRLAWNNLQLLPPAPIGAGPINGVWDASQSNWNTHSTVMHYATTSNSWLKIGAGQFIPVWNTLFVTTKKNHTKKQILKDSDDYSWDAYYGLLFGFLHGVDMNNEKISNMTRNTANYMGRSLPSGYLDYVEYVKYELEAMPCTGPHNFLPSNSNVTFPIVDGWNVAKRWDAPWYAMVGLDHLGNNVTTTEGGYYSGLDFMALHNLYYLNSDSQLPKYVNYIHRYLDDDILNIPPFNQSPLTYGAFVSMTADNKISSNLDVAYKASEVITLKPGFHVENGAEFHAYIEPVLCGQSFLKAGSQDSEGSQTTYGMVEVNELKNHDDLAPKFDHLYTMPDSINFDELQEYVSSIENSYSSDLPSTDMIKMKMARLEVSPNPAHDIIQVKCHGLDGDLVYQVLDANGHLAMEGSYDPNSSISVEELPSGLYLVKVSDGSLYVTSKFVKK